MARTTDTRNVTREDLDTSEERKQFTEDNQDKAVIERSDGSIQVVDSDSGEVEKGFTADGKQQVSVTVSKKGGGRRTRQSDLQQEKQEEIERAVKGEEEPLTGTAAAAEKVREERQAKAIRDGNFSGTDGTISRIEYDTGENQSKATDEELERIRSQQVQPYEVVQVNEPKSRLQRFTEEITYGFKVGSGLVYDPSTVGRVRSGNNAASVAEQTGFLAGAIAPFVAANQAPRIANLGLKAEQALATTRVAQVVQSTRVGRFATGLAAGTGQSLAIVEVGKGLGTADLSPQERELLKNPAVREAIKQGRRAEEQAVNDAGIPLTVAGKDFNVNPRKIGFELIGTKLSGKVGDEAFQKELERNLSNTNLTSFERRLAVSAALDEKAAADTSELGAFLNIARFSEGFGRREINRIFQEVPIKGNTALKTGLIVAPSIGTAGFIEGFAQEVTQQNVREQNLDLQKAVGMGGFGAVSAATLGGTIAGGGIVKNPTTRAIELGTYITDPFEKPGDLLQDVTERAIGSARGRVIAAEPIFVGDSNNLVRDINPRVSAVESLPKNPGVIKGSEQSILTTTFNVPSNVRVPTPTQVFSNLQSNLQAPINNPVPAPTNTNIPINTNVPVPVPTNPNIPANILTSINVPVPVPTTTQTPVPVPVVIPEQGFFPFPPQKPAGSPGQGGRRRRKKGSKRSRTRSLAQQLFQIPDEFILQQDGGSEVTGLFLRDF